MTSALLGKTAISNLPLEHAAFPIQAGIGCWRAAIRVVGRAHTVFAQLAALALVSPIANRQRDAVL